MKANLSLILLLLILILSTNFIVSSKRKNKIRKTFDKNFIEGKDFTIIDNPNISKKTIDDYLKICNDLNSSLYDANDKSCENKKGIIYLANIKDNSMSDSLYLTKIELNAVYLSVNNYLLMLSKTKDTFDDLFIKIDLSQIEKISPINEFKASGCFTIYYSSVSFKELQLLSFCDLNFNNDSSSTFRDSKHFWVSSIVNLKECRYKGDITFQNPKIKSENLMKKTLSNKMTINLENPSKEKEKSKKDLEELSIINEEFKLDLDKKMIQDTFLKEISNIIEEGNVEQQSLKRSFNQKLKSVKAFENQLKEDEINLSQKASSLDEFNSLNSVDMNEDPDNLKFVKMIKDIKAQILKSKIDQVEKLKNKFDKLIQQNEFISYQKSQKVLDEQAAKAKIQVNNQCGNASATIDSICTELFGLSGKETCISQTNYFCNRCCNFYIGINFAKELTNCLSKCESARSSLNKN